MRMRKEENKKEKREIIKIFLEKAISSNIIEDKQKFLNEIILHVL